MTSYPNIFTSIFQTAVELWPSRRITSTFLRDFVLDMKRYGRVTTNDIITVCGIAVGMTLLRSALTKFLLEPFALKVKFTPKNIMKFPESFWKFSYYLVMYIYTCYLLFGKSYPYYENPRTCWTEWSVGMHIPSDIYYLYSIQASFYLHSIYATFYMDPWRRDSIAMVIHHVLTIFLIGFSFAVRYYKVGVVVLFLHDICDVLLEFAKIFVCCKIRDNKQYKWPEIFINVGFLLFAFSWFYCRLYLYPYKVLYPSGHYAVYLQPHAPFYYFFNGMLLFLFAMDIYWFHFIILLIWRVATGKSKEVEDTRELGVPEEGNHNKANKEATEHRQTEYGKSTGDVELNHKDHDGKLNSNITNGNCCGKENIVDKRSNGLVEHHVGNHNVRQRQPNGTQQKFIS